ncbi:hypothetical protein RB195_004063 [Necator americanus]|uniref:VASt domain-containing protein n=1 Tax=Necator americanus TaxID=51031 RepID=A0ABR1BG48_NECAM
MTPKDLIFGRQRLQSAVWAAALKYFPNEFGFFEFELLIHEACRLSLVPFALEPLEWSLLFSLSSQSFFAAFSLVTSARSEFFSKSRNWFDVYVMLTFVDTNRRRLPRSISYDEATKFLDRNDNLILPQTGKGKSRISLRKWFATMRNRRSCYTIDGYPQEDLQSNASSDNKSLRTISSDHLLRERLDSPDCAQESRPDSESSQSSAEKKNDDVTTPSRSSEKKKKYFSERANNKNIFKKLIHPSYHERAAQYRRLFEAKVAPGPDEFLASFSCAYQREILCQGRMYISQRHICFYANIFGWETNLVLPVSEVAAITKEKAAKIFPNSIQIEMKDETRHFFASFVNREKSLTVLLKVLEKVQTEELMSPEELWEYMNPEDDEKAWRRRSGKSKPENSMNTSEPNTPDMTPASRSLGEFPSIVEASSQSSLEQEDVNCPCDSHAGKLLLDNVYPLSVEEIYELLFTDSPWFKKFNDTLKNTGYVASAWTTDKDGVRSRTCTYTMALNHAMAPKSCVVTEKQVISHFGRNGDGFIVNKETQNSGIPYANDFTIQCIYCVSKVSDHEARIKVHGGIVYKKNIWSVVRGYIEKSTYQGLDDHYSALEDTLRDECERKAMRPEARQDHVDRYDEESMSSVEDPITEAPRIRSPPARSRVTKRDTSASLPTITPTLTTTSTDYGFYIKIIICLLAGLLFLNTLLLFHVNKIETQATISEDVVQVLQRLADYGKPNEQTVALENLLEKVNQLTTDLQKLKQQISSKQEL